jgi:hypothetical protein
LKKRNRCRFLRRIASLHSIGGFGSVSPVSGSRHTATSAYLQIPSIDTNTILMASPNPAYAGRGGRGGRGGPPPYYNNNNNNSGVPGPRPPTGAWQPAPTHTMPTQSTAVPNPTSPNPHHLTPQQQQQQPPLLNNPYAPNQAGPRGNQPPPYPPPAYYNQHYAAAAQQQQQPPNPYGATGRVPWQPVPNQGYPSTMRGGVFYPPPAAAAGPGRPSATNAGTIPASVVVPRERKALVIMVRPECHGPASPALRSSHTALPDYSCLFLPLATFLHQNRIKTAT